MKIVKLAEVCKLVGGGTPSKSNGSYFIGDIPWATVRDLRSRWLEQTEHKINETAVLECSTNIIPSGNVVLASRVGLGKVVQLKFDTAINQDLRALIPFEGSELDSNYLFYWTLSIAPLIVAAGKGATVQGVTLPFLENLSIPLPSLDEQRDIVRKLDSAFAEIDLLLENLRLSDEKANQLTNSILNSQYSLQGLNIEPLEKIVDILDNQRIPINATERSQRVGDVPYYGATGQVGTIDKAIFNETLILLGEDGVPFFDSTKHKAYEISGPSWVNNHAHVIRAKPGFVNQRYLLHFLNAFNYAGYVNGATRLKLTQGDMKRIPVPVPSLDKQSAVVEKLDSAFAEINKIRNQIAIKKDFAGMLRKSLLSDAFSSNDDRASA